MKGLSNVSGLLEAVEKVGRKIPLTTLPSTEKPRGRGEPGRIARMRDRHHTTARMLAAGVPDEVVCRQLGYTLTQLDLLREQTPAFQELLVLYSGPKAKARREGYEEYYDTLESARNYALQLLRDKLFIEGDELSTSELMKVIDSFSDRTGYSKNLINTVINTTLGERLEASRRRRTPAGAGDGDGGVLSSITRADSAPPLLDLQPEPQHPALVHSRPQDPLTTVSAPFSKGTHRRPK